MVCTDSNRNTENSEPSLFESHFHLPYFSVLFNILIKSFCCFLSLVLFAACQMEVNITKNSSAQSPLLENQEPSFKPTSMNSDFVVGEIVTTPTGAVFKGTFGEISEKQVLPNRVSFDGVFYE